MHTTKNHMNIKLSSDIMQIGAKSNYILNIFIVVNLNFYLVCNMDSIALSFTEKYSVFVKTALVMFST